MRRYHGRSAMSLDADVTRILADLDDGDVSAADRLLPIVYEELRALAASFLRLQRPDHTLQPTALVHEAYLRLIGSDKPWAGRAHFFAVATKAMRQILINHAHAHRAVKRGRGRHRLTLDEGIDSAANAGLREVDLLALDEALTTLERLDPRQCRVVELRYLGGLTVDEVAQVLDVSPRTVQLDWRMARLWLLQELSEEQ